MSTKGREAAKIAAIIGGGAVVGAALGITLGSEGGGGNEARCRPVCQAGASSSHPLQSIGEERRDDNGGAQQSIGQKRRP